MYIAGWALHRCRRFTTTAPSILIHLPKPESILVIRDKTYHLRLEALLVNLYIYNVTYDVGNQAQQIWAELLEGANTKLPEVTDEIITLPTFKHVPIDIIYPATSRPLPIAVVDNPHM